MSGIKGFIWGFCLSLSGVALCGQPYSHAPSEIQRATQPHVKINLFKSADASTQTFVSKNIFTPVSKQSLHTEGLTPFVVSEISPDGIEDDEILNINIDGDVPIEFGNALSEADTIEVISEDDEQKSALLPESLRDDEKIAYDNPWSEVKSASNIKNKQLLEQIQEQNKEDLFTDNLQKLTQNDETISYKVAEKIKQSIIFPIPDEILNDENLTPTFINSQGSKSSTKPKKMAVKPRQNKPSQDSSTIAIPTAPVVSEKDSTSEKSIMDSISSWFTDASANTEQTVTSSKRQAPPSYSSQEKSPVKTQPKKGDDFASLYESLQETKNEYIRKRILPSELKLSFQPDRAEISGSTLQWLKSFSEASQDEDTYLQVRLDANTSTELQKKRLNLLYTIFMNNGVNFKKIDTQFSLTEPNAFIIRIIRLK